MTQLVAIGLVAAVLGTAAPQEKPAVSEPATTTTPAPAAKPAGQEEQGEAKGMVDAIAAIGSIITGAGEKTEETAATPAPASTASSETTLGADKKAAEPTVVAKKPRSAKNSAALITAGAAAGAALGGALGKGSKAAMYGAALGGVAGLIYDRMTYKNPGKI